MANGQTFIGSSTAVGPNRISGLFGRTAAGGAGFWVATRVSSTQMGNQFAFNGTLSSGPDAHTVYSGTLELWGDTFGGLLGWLTQKGGTVLPASGQDVNGNVNMQIVVRSGTPMFVSGTTLAGGNLQGTISGPLAGDQGSWTATKMAPSKAQASVAIKTLALDCVGTSASCSAIAIQGDPVSTLPNGQPSPFSGYADPSMRKDPLSSRLWMSYSWPNVHVLVAGRKCPSVDIHLAYSDDQGKTWHYQGPLWPSFTDTDKGGIGSTGFTGNEVSNIYPVRNRSSVTWYGIHESYFVPDVGAYKQRSPSSFRLEITQAATPQGLSSAIPRSLELKPPEQDGE